MSSVLCTAAEIERGAVKNALAATVYIEVERLYHGYGFSNAGTGFFVHSDGYVMTNWHVVADQVKTVWNGTVRELPLTVVNMQVVVNPGSPQGRSLRAKIVAREGQGAARTGTTKDH